MNGVNGMNGMNGMDGMNGMNGIGTSVFAFSLDQEPAASDAQADAKADDGYAPAVGVSRAEKEQAARIEQQVSAKVASDYVHIVWAYGILWSLFVVYGIFLWRKSAALKADMDDLRRALHERSGGG